MSYCRWSCDCYRSDLYVYESSRGYESHVANRRLNVEPPPELVAMPESTTEEWVSKSLAESNWYDSLKDDMGNIPDALWLDLESLGPEAGEHYIDTTPGDCAARLRALSDKGFNVPVWAIEGLEEEEPSR